MTVVTAVDGVRDWLSKNVCSKIQLKVPNDNDITQKKWACPAAHSRYIPPAQRVPENPRGISGVPCVIVIPLQGEDDPDKMSIKLHMQHVIWEPGADGVPDSEGWRSLYNFMEITRRALRCAAIIAGMTLQYPVRYGVFNEDATTPDTRPYYAGWVEASFTAALPKVNDDRIQRLLD